VESDTVATDADSRAEAPVDPADLEAPAEPPEIVEPAGPEFVGPPAPETGPGGDVVILLEKGFIAHRVERSLNIPLFPEETNALSDSDDDVRTAAASCVAARAFDDLYDFASLLADSGTQWQRGPDGRCLISGVSNTDEQDEDDPDRGFYLMRVAWPEMVSSGLPGDLSVSALSVETVPLPVLMASLDGDVGESAVASVAAENEPAVSDQPDSAGPAMDTDPPTIGAPGMNASLSAAAMEEFQDQLGGILIKSVARTAAKYGLARGLEKEIDKKNETLGDIAFLTANAAAALLERADTRCWHLLPDEVSIVRLRLPAGRHPLTLRVDAGASGTQLIDLGEVDVRDGGVRVLSARVWP
jgi:hypothetical protein